MDENSSEMASIMSNFRLVAETANVAVVAIHHPVKAPNKQNILRGHGSINAALDLALSITAKAHIVKVECTKSRGADVEPFSAEFEYKWKPGRQELETARFYAVENGTSRDELYCQKIVKEILAESDKPIPKTELSKKAAERAKIGEKKAREIIGKMDGKDLVMTPGDRGAKLYSLKPQNDSLAKLGN